jgi:riboflavin kinase/FMN adenylyltransferase
MKIIRGNDVATISNLTSASAVALGNFDGIHKGHKKIIEQLKKASEHLGLAPSIMTFEPHPLKLFKPDLKNYRLTTIDEKTEILASLGIKQLFIMDFTPDFSKISANDFISEYLIKALKTKLLFTGEDFHFGFKRQGSPALLQQAAESFGFTYQPMSAIKNNDGVRYSSSNIRKAISEGNIEAANELLGHEFFISGEVIKGLQNGRTIGFPTANLQFSEDKVMPSFGVYSSTVEFEGKQLRSITNIGIKPTVGGKEPLCETHIFDFDGNLYTKQIKVMLKKFIRAEQKFTSLDELKQQIKKDISSATE